MNAQIKTQIKTRTKNIFFALGLFWILVFGGIVVLQANAATVVPTGSFSSAVSSYLSVSGGSSAAAAYGSIAISDDIVSLTAESTAGKDNCNNTTYSGNTSYLEITNRTANVLMVEYSSNGFDNFGNFTSDTLYLQPKATLCFRVTSGNSSNSKTASATFEVNSVTVVSTDSVKDIAAVYSVNGTEYTYFDQALSAAGADGTIVLAQSGVMKCSDGAKAATIPSGVTLVLPYQPGNSTVDDADSTKVPYGNYITYNVLYSGTNLNPSFGLLYALEIPSDFILTCNGVISIGGTVVGGGYPGSCCGMHSNLILDGQLNIGSTGVLSSVGYLLGDGLVSTVSGSKIYQPYILTDYIGSGGYTALLSYNAADLTGLGSLLGSVNGISTPTVEGEDAVMPFEQYCMINIQTKISFVYGAKMYGYADIFASNSHNQAVNEVIGSNGLLQLKEGASVQISYETGNEIYTNCGRTILELTGGFDVGSMDLTIPVAGGSATIHSNDLVFMVPYNYTLILKNGVYDIADGVGLKILPGAEIYVEDGATVNLNGKLIVYDGYTDRRNASGKYPTTATLQAKGYEGNGILSVSGTGVVNINGTFGGVIQTSGGGTLCVGSNATLQMTSRNFGTGTDKILGNTYTLTGGTTRTLTAQLLSADTLELVEMQQSTSYYGLEEGTATLETYNYNVYTNASSPNTATACNNVELGANITGSWYTHRVDYYENGSQVDSLTTYHIGGFPTNPTSMEYSHATGNALTFYAHGVWTAMISDLSYVQKYNRTCAETLSVFADSEKTTQGAITPNYRLKDYLWLNAYCYLGGTFDTSKLFVTTYDTNGNVIATNGVGATNVNKDSVQIAVVGTTVYLVKAIPAKEIPDSFTFSISYNDGSKTYNSVRFTVSLPVYSDTLTGTDATLADKLLDYGNAAKDYFDTNTTLESGHVITGNTVGDGFKLSQTGAPNPWNGVTLETTGANVYYDEALRLGISYQLSGIPEGYSIAQVGLLVGKTGEELLLETATKAYLLYDLLDGKTVDGKVINNETLNGVHSDNRPWDKDNKVINVTPDSLVQPSDLKSGTIIFDLAMQDYKSMFAIRPAIVLENNGTYVCVYGRQIGYGLGAYINGVYAGATDEYKYLLEQTWALAIAINGN